MITKSLRRDLAIVSWIPNHADVVPSMDCGRTDRHMTDFGTPPDDESSPPDLRDTPLIHSPRNKRITTWFSDSPTSAS